MTRPWRLICLTIVAGCLLAGVCASAPVASAARAPSLASSVGRPPHTYLPLVGRGLLASSCPVDSSAEYRFVPVLPTPADRPAALHPDLNLAIRGYAAAPAYLGLLDYAGPTDPDAPQLAGMFADGRVPDFSAAYRVYDWDWGCGADGCRAEPIAWPGVTLLSLVASPGESIAVPSRRAEIYFGRYVALVLYADEQRITLKYTREDSAATGYTVHIEGVCVDPNLLSLYRSLDAAGRESLPALRNGEAWGVAAHAEFRVAVRDVGAFLDPRSRKDWWSGR